MTRKWTLSLALSLLGAGLLLPRGAASGADAPRTIPIVAHRFEFTPSTLTLERGETVKLVVTSQDVHHGFLQRDLKIDADIAPGEPAEILVTPDRAGTFTIICDHFCGAGHGGMKLTVTVP